MRTTQVISNARDVKYKVPKRLCVMRQTDVKRRGKASEDIKLDKNKVQSNEKLNYHR
jgi:hypothetical protein